MAIFAVGDLHLSNNKNIEKPMDIFGELWTDHAERLREAWLREVKEEDTVIIAGDISWAMRLDEAMDDLEWIHQLPGRKIAIRGNHDLWWHGIRHMNTLFDDIEFIQNDCRQAEGLFICGSRGWICPGTNGFDASDEKIYKRELLRLEASLSEAKKQGAERIIGVLHYPPTNDKMQPSGFTELFQRFGAERVLYGHLHGKDSFGKGFKGNLNGVRYDLISLDYLECGLLKIKGDETDE